MKPAEIKALRRAIGLAVKHEQDLLMERGFPTDEVVPNIMAALLSLASYMAAHNVPMSRYNFEQACKLAASEYYK